MVSDMLFRVRSLITAAATLVLALSFICPGQNSNAAGQVQKTSFENYPAVTFSTGKLAVTIMVKGSTIASLILADDPGHLSPLWNPMRMTRELGGQPKYEGGAGHFVCVDGFGPVSAEEKAAGLPGHGEAHTEMFEVSSKHEGALTVLTMNTHLPILQENFTRTFTGADGESVVSVESELESLLGFDHPANWAEHATIGSPFLESGVTVVDLSGSRSRTRPYEQVNNGQTQRRLQSGQDFAWPMAPGLDGKTINLRETPETPHYLDHATTLLDPNRTIEWVTALNPHKRLLLGYLLKRSEYPWLQYWGNYPPSQKMARGMEFSTQPFDVPKREVISMGSLFDTPTFRWLPARSKIKTKFLLFYVQAPDGFEKVDNVTLENGEIVVRDQQAQKEIKLKTVATLEP